jgi:hypothetical protein
MCCSRCKNTSPQCRKLASKYVCEDYGQIMRAIRPSHRTNCLKQNYFRQNPSRSRPAAADHRDIGRGDLQPAAPLHRHQKAASSPMLHHHCPSPLANQPPAPAPKLHPPRPPFLSSCRPSHTRCIEFTYIQDRTRALGVLAGSAVGRRLHN